MFSTWSSLGWFPMPVTFIFIALKRRKSSVAKRRSHSVPWIFWASRMPMISLESTTHKNVHLHTKVQCQISMKASRKTVKCKIKKSSEKCEDQVTDEWQLGGDHLVRIHRVPRTALFLPDAGCPLDSAWLDFYRTTKLVYPLTPKGSMSTFGTQKAPNQI